MKKSLQIKVVIDRETNRVLFVESDRDFVDHLLSFLTLPIATVIRLITQQEKDAEDKRKKKDAEDKRFISSMKNLCRKIIVKDDTNHVLSSSSTLFKPMKNLYNSVQNLKACHLQTKECKNMLLYPRRQFLPYCGHLLKYDDKEKTRYYYCEDHPETFSYSERLACDCSFTGTDNDKISPHSGSSVFVKRGRYVTSEGMNVMTGSLDTCISLLDIHGICNGNRLEQRDLNIGVDEVLLLLKCSLFSNTPLTDVILRKGTSNNPASKTKHNKGVSTHQSAKDMLEDSYMVTMTLVVRKSNNQALYVKAKEDFMDFLFSFLTFPLGYVIKLFDGSSPMACLDNLYESVGNLSRDAQIISKAREEALVCPKLAPHFGCGKNQLFSIEEADPVLEIKDPDGSNKRAVKIINPKSTNKGETSSGGGFIKGPSTFMVTNDLVVTPLCLTSEVFYLKELNIPYNDVEERVVKIGKHEALNLLKASVFSTEAFSPIAKTSKGGPSFK